MKKTNIRRIAILSSMSFKKKIIELKLALTDLGYEVGTLYETANLNHSKRTHDRLKKELDLISANYNYVNANDAVLVLNFTKGGTKNYIGGNTLIEMAFAHIQKKPIYLFNSIPKISYRAEIESMKPIIICGDLSKIQ